MTGTSPADFEVHIDDDVLEDLRDRLGRTRVPPRPAMAGWELGTDPDVLATLLRYWREDYDWRAHEAAMNRWEQVRVVLDGVPIHVLRARAASPGAMPLVLTHGWPWTFWDFQHLLGPLSDPAAHGGDPADAFDVVVPSLPGYGFSTPLGRTDVGVVAIADLWRRLMTEVLGFHRFGAHGGDWGAIVSTRLGHAYPDDVTGVHITLPLPLPVYGGRVPARHDYAPEEAGWRERTLQFLREETGYSAIQSTKPESLAVGMTDSPAALAAWLLEKRRTWSDCGGDVERVFSLDDLCTTIMLYWATRCFGSAARLYWVERRRPWVPPGGRIVDVPTGVCVSPQDVVLMPRRWVERRYDLHRWTVLEGGGHFAPMERPDELVADIRAFYRPLRERKPR